MVCLKATHRFIVMTQIDSSHPTCIRPTHSSENSIDSRINPWLLSLLYPLARIILPAYFGSMTVTGKENLPRKGPFIIAPTHRSRWDAIIVPFVAGRYGTGNDLHFMVMANEMKGLQGWFIRNCGGFPVNLKHPGISSLRYGIELLQRGESMVLFPEGGIFRDRIIHRLKPGLARIALQAETNCPGLGIQVIPMSVSYSQELPGRGCNIDVCIGSPLHVADYCAGTTKQMAHHLTTDLTVALQNLLGN